MGSSPSSDSQDISSIYNPSSSVTWRTFTDTEGEASGIFEKFREGFHGRFAACEGGDSSPHAAVARKKTAMDRSSFGECKDTHVKHLFVLTNRCTMDAPEEYSNDKEPECAREPFISRSENSTLT
jgi:hypothetical protein